MVSIIKNVEEVVARHTDVQRTLSNEATTVAIKAFQILKSSGQFTGLNAGGSLIKVEEGGKTDWFVTLEDRNLSNVKRKVATKGERKGDPLFNLDREANHGRMYANDSVSAESIEFGRSGYVDQFGVPYGEMRGKFALTIASGGDPVRKVSRRVRRPRKYSKAMLDALTQLRKDGLIA